VCAAAGPTNPSECEIKFETAIVAICARAGIREKMKIAKIS